MPERLNFVVVLQAILVEIEPRISESRLNLFRGRGSLGLIVFQKASGYEKVPRQEHSPLPVPQTRPMLFADFVFCFALELFYQLICALCRVEPLLIMPYIGFPQLLGERIVRKQPLKPSVNGRKHVLVIGVEAAFNVLQEAAVTQVS